MLAGHTIVGAWLSVTVTLKPHVPVLPEASVALQETAVVPFGNVEPDGGLQLTGPTPGQLSDALTE